MSSYYSIPNKFNRFLLLLITVAPFAAYVLYKVTTKDFNTTITMLSYFGIVLIFFYGNSKNPVKFPIYLWFYLFFIIYMFYSTFYILDRDFKMSYLMTNREIGAFNFMLILENLSFSKKHFNRLLKISKAVLIIAFFVIIIQQVHNENFFVRPDLVTKGFSKELTAEDRIDSIYSWLGSNSSGYGFIPIFIILAEVLARKKKPLLIWIIFGLTFAMLARARWLMINALLVFLILIVNHKDKAKRALKYAILIPIIAIGTYTLLNNVGINAKDIVENRILEKNDKASQKSSSTRILAFVIFNKLYWKNAVFGKGNEKYGMGSTKARHNYELQTLLGGKSSQIHVGYLMLFYMYGLVGGIPFMIFLFLITKKLYKDAKLTTYWGPFLAFLGFALSNLTLVHFSVFEMGLLFALLTNKYYLERHNKLLLSTNNLSK